MRRSERVRREPERGQHTGTSRAADTGAPGHAVPRFSTAVILAGAPVFGVGCPRYGEGASDGRDLPDDEMTRAGAGAQPGLWDQWLAAACAALPEPPGRGFAAGGSAEELAPGPALGSLVAQAWENGLDVLGDDALIGVMGAWRRLSAWAAAGELAAVSELSRRREAQVAAGADPHLIEHLDDEVAAALTLTHRSADLLLDFAATLDSLPLTRQALASGQIDRARAQVICDEVGGLSPGHSAAVESAVIGRAPGQTTGQLRGATRRAVLAADPSAADRRREEALKDARVEVWGERAGTSALAGRDLPPAEVLAADKRIGALAGHLKKGGATGSLDQLRASVFTALLLGRPIDTLLPRPSAHPVSPASSGPPAAGPGGQGTGGPALSGPGLGGSGLGGSVNLTMPLSTWLGAGQEPGEAAGFGPMSASDSQALAGLLAQNPDARWCLTLTGADGRAVAHGCAQARSASAAGWAVTFTVRPFAAGDCAHERESRAYRPSPSLQHWLRIRQRTCTFPGCRQPAARCDIDHTVSHGRGGLTCECNTAPLCRRHHRAKQTEGWRLEQPTPGVMRWTLPHGRSYEVEPEPYLSPCDPGGP